MQGTITSNIDVAQVALYVFWLFFAGLIFYLRREDKREGYPLEPDRSGQIRVQGFPWMPSPKTFLLPHGGSVMAPSGKVDDRQVRAEPIGGWPGAPLEPTGNPMVDGVGPASYAARSDEPELTIDGHPSIVPTRVASDHVVDSNDTDPKGMEVFGADRMLAGTVRDIWVDRTEPMIRYLEVEVAGAQVPRNVLLPITLASINRRRQVYVSAILATQFADVPGLKNPDQVTKLEEDRICAYYASGKLYATPGRLGPVL
ncbi:MAG TPA: photosynthetic reaction center subunit H [Vineibacter sp.]|nr:photosynthetic reaction center subunit H [Vineibacter sp.]